MRNRMSQPTALVTGASSGIVLELAKRLAADGYRVVLVARDRQRLNAAAVEIKQAGGEAVVIPADLADPKAPEAIVSKLRTAKLAVDVLVNNAGYGLQGPFVATSPADERAMIRVNVEALTALTKLIVPDMVARGRGRIMNVASVAGFLPGPLMAVYYASKAYVVSLSTALRAELAPSGVTVTCLCPGPTRTGFAKRTGNAELFRRPMSAETVARIGYRGMMNGRGIVVPGIRNKLAVFLLRFIPRSLAAKAALANNGGGSSSPRR